jgi:hypothetical protein
MIIEMQMIIVKNVDIWGQAIVCIPDAESPKGG